MIGDSILNGIDQHGLSNKSFKLRDKNHHEQQLRIYATP